MKEKVTIEEKAKNKNNITAQQINEVLRGKIYKPKTQLMMWQRIIKKVAPPKTRTEKLDESNREDDR